MIPLKSRYINKFRDVNKEQASRTGTKRTRTSRAFEGRHKEFDRSTASIEPTFFWRAWLIFVNFLPGPSKDPGLGHDVTSDPPSLWAWGFEPQGPGQGLQNGSQKSLRTKINIPVHSQSFDHKKRYIRRQWMIWRQNICTLNIQSKENTFITTIISLKIKNDSSSVGRTGYLVRNVSWTLEETKPRNVFPKTVNTLITIIIIQRDSIKELKLININQEERLIC